MPILFRYLIDSAKPTAPAIFGVPASNFHGRSFHDDFSNVTLFIISPPYKKGSIFSNNSFLPYKTPIPVGPAILCQENAKNRSQALLHQFSCEVCFALRQLIQLISIYGQYLLSF